MDIRQPFIALCGASDLRRLVKEFVEVVEGFNCLHGNYLDGTAPNQHDADYKRNSELMIENSDILVFNVLKYYGDLTWKVEFYQTLLSNKPFVIMIEEDLFQSFEDGGGKISSFKKSHPSYKIFELIAGLIANQRPFVTFKESEYQKILRTKVSGIFFRSFDLLMRELQSTTIEKVLRRFDENEIRHYKPNQTEISYVKEQLLDRSKEKPFRKASLLFLKFHGSLKQNELLLLFNDPETGLTRYVLENLHDLITPDMDIDEVSNAIIDRCHEDKDQVSILHLSIPALFKNNFIKALEYFPRLFPAQRSSASITILKTLVDTDSEYIRNLSSDNVGTTKQLVKLSKQHNPNDPEIVALYVELIKKHTILA